MHPLVNQFLTFLQVEKKEPTLDYLNELVCQHQLRVRWENITKILDWENGNESGDFLPPIETYMERVTTKGYGGTCWSIAVGFYWLLDNLGFDVQYIYMDPGHLCLRVNLDQAYYVDVGYCAPLFQAYPLLESFTAHNVRETFEYTVVTENEIHVVRTPGPTKTLSPTPRNSEDMVPLIQKSNIWETSPMFQEIRIFGYIDNMLTSITNTKLKQYRENETYETELTQEEMTYWITEKFNMDYEMHKEAMRVYTKYVVPSK
jgi:arylamine N-acetyltransferase